MIDIDASLQAIESHPSFWVEFSTQEEDGEKLSLEIKSNPRKQRRLLDKYIKMATQFSSTTDKAEEKSLEIVADWAGLAQALTEFVINWKGFNGVFDREKLKRWFDAYSSYAIAFAQNFKGVLDRYESDMLKRKELEVKN